MLAKFTDAETAFHPTAEFRFFIYEPDGNGFIYFKSAEDRDKASEWIINQYLDDGWSESVEQVVAGELSHTCEQINVRNKPDAADLDEDGCDGEGQHWGEFDTICNYALVPLAGAIESAEQQEPVSAA